ncbi:54S ribosomal protein L22, mitochondrial [Ascosphaera atra]|nr:54S ribosomal protein L22, mitochondrial [Ascosphaera atra]
MVAAAVASFFSRQLACPAAKPGLRFPLALPALSLTPRRTFTNTRAPRADIDDDLPRPKMGSGSLTSSSIFADEEDMQTFEPPTTKGAKPKSPHLDADGKPLKPKDKKKKTSTDFDLSDAIPLEKRDREAMMATLLPHPNRTARWQRKMVIRAIQKRGRLTQEETRLRTEVVKHSAENV